MKTRFPLLALAATAALLAGVATAQAAPAPAWGVLAATGPTHLAPEQSETQRIAVEAEGGEFALGYSAEGQGTLSWASGLVHYTEGSTTATVLFGGPFKEDQVIYFESGATPKVAYGTVIEHVSGSVLTLSAAADATGNATTRAADLLVTEVANAEDFTPFVGEEITGEGIPAGTTIAAADGGEQTVTLSELPTQAGATTLKASKQTALLPYNATPGALQEALEAEFGAGNFSVTGGPGGDLEHPYFVAFTGAFAETDQKPLVPDSSELEGEHAIARVFTTVPGGPGTGFIGVFATNFGGAPTSETGEVTVEVGPLPAGIAVPEASTHAGWSCGKAEPGEALTCSSTAVVAAFTQAQPIKVPVEVRAGAAPESSAQVRVSGAGGGEASYAMPIVVSTEPAPPGIAAFTFGFYEADGSLSTQAGAHPYSSSTEFILNSVRVPSGGIKPAGDAREVIVDLPAGLVGDPLVVKRCPQSQLTPEAFFEVAACPAAESESQLGTFEPMLGFANSSFPFGIYSGVPAYGTAAQFTSKNVSPIVALFGSLRSEGDFGPRVTAPNSATQLEQVISGFTVFYGFPEAAHGKAFFTNPSDCAEQARRTPQLRTEISTWQHPEDFSVASVPVAPVTGCEKLSLHPGFSFQPSSTQGSSGVGAEAHLHMDQSGLTDAEQLGPPPLKRSVVKLPEGLTINPAQANGLEACSEAQVGYRGSGELPNPTRFNNDPVSCPDASKLGTAEATSPLLDEPLKGTIYLAKQDENPFHTLIGLYLVFESPRFGITLKLPGRIDPDPNTGQLTATFDYLPQQPVEDFTLHFRGGGPHSELATPEVCGTYTTQGSWEPWSAPESGPPAQTSDSFNVSSNCASSPGARPFNPSFEAGSTDPVAGSYSPLVIKVGRNDGEQELRSLDFTMPPGITGKLAGIPYCSDGEIAAAQGKSGRDEQNSPSCPAASKLGTIGAAAGVGSDPFHVGGDLYLAGPYKGAPLSAVAITPAVAGPFDLGNVVIRTPLKVDPVTAQISADSDPIPTSPRGNPAEGPLGGDQHRPPRVHAQPDELRSDAGHGIHPQLRRSDRKPRQPLPGRRLPRPLL